MDKVLTVNSLPHNKNIDLSKQEAIAFETSIFSFSHSVFYPFWRSFRYFHEIQNCRLHLFSVSKSLNFVVWERVNSLTHNAAFDALKDI